MQLELESVIFKATQNSDSNWKQEAEATIDLMILRGKDFTSEDILRILDEKGVKTHDNRALGGLILRRSKSGDIEFSRYTKATRSSRHNAPIAVWSPVRFKGEGMAD